jgi:hypothetical protein
MSCAIKLLAYYVIQNPKYQPGVEGVRGAPVQSLNVDSLTCVYSPLIPPQQFERDDAIRFHAVLNAAFQQQAIIPFRFPTILQNEVDLQSHLREKLSVYSSDLQRLADMVQMELRMNLKQEPASGKSGTDYLRAKQQRSQSLQSSSQAARALLESLVNDWRERPTDHGLRCYALVRRIDVEAFRQKLTATEGSGSSRTIVSGPWPATEFFHE